MPSRRRPTEPSPAIASDACTTVGESPDDFLSVRQAAAILNVSYGSVLAAVHGGSLAAYRFGPRGGTYRIRRSDLTEYINSARTRQTRQVKVKHTGSVFKCLDGERLIRAWREPGVIVDDDWI